MRRVVRLLKLEIAGNVVVGWRLHLHGVDRRMGQW